MAQEPLLLAVGVVGAPRSGKSWLVDAFGRCAGKDGAVQLENGATARCVFEELSAEALLEADWARGAAAPRWSACLAVYDPRDAASFAAAIKAAFKADEIFACAVRFVCNFADVDDRSDAGREPNAEDAFPLRAAWSGRFPEHLSEFFGEFRVRTGRFPA